MNNKIGGLHFAKPHGQQGIFDGTGRLIQKRTKTRRVFIDKYVYMHFTNVPRSSSLEKDILVNKRKMKLKHEVGKSFISDFFFPEVFFRQRPSIVPNPWEVMDGGTMLKSYIQTFPKVIKRSFFQADKSGY